MSTFTLPRYYEGTPGQDVMYHGVGKFSELIQKTVHDNHNSVKHF